MDRHDKVRILETVMNAPEVLPNVAPGHESVSAGTFFETPGNFMFGDERGIVLFTTVADGLVEGHYLLTNELRGREGLVLVRYAISQLFTFNDAWAIQGNTPRDMLHARCMNRALGFTPIGTSVDTAGRDCIKYILERFTWARLSAQA